MKDNIIVSTDILVDSGKYDIEMAAAGWSVDEARTMVSARSQVNV